MRRMELPLKASRNIWLTDNKLILGYPKAFDALNNIGEAVVFSLLPIAYQEASNIELPQDAPIEPGTQARIDAICALWNKWFHTNRRIKVMAKIKPSEIKAGIQRYSAQLFSGGVDSLATLKSHEDEVKYLILYNGADIRLTRPERFKEIENYLRKCAEDFHKELLTITTNVHYLHPVSWEHLSHSCAMVGPLLALSRYIDKVYIASSFSGEIGKRMSWGSHPELDILVRSDKVETIHDGFEHTRVEKIKVIASDAKYLRNIRVCGSNIRGSYNCGSCEKCYRTSMILSLLGVSQQAVSFPKESFSLKSRADFISRAHLKDYTKLFWCENLEFLETSLLDTENKKCLLPESTKQWRHYQICH